MRTMFFGLVAVIGWSSICLAQNNAVQPRAGQNQPGQAQPNQPARPGQTVQPRQPAQPGLQPAQPGQNTGQRVQAGQQTASADQEIAALVHGCASNEIEIAKFAESKAKSDDVREFAQMMVREHSPGAEEMKRLAGSLASDSGQQGRPGAQGGRLDWVSVHKQVGDQCVATTKKELSAKEGHEFDQCFIMQQIGAHLKTIDELKVLRNHASSELQQKLDKEMQIAQQHLEHAKKIEKSLDDDKSSERLTRRPDGNK
jgi:putative membrane protein